MLQPFGCGVPYSASAQKLTSLLCLLPAGRSFLQQLQRGGLPQGQGVGGETALRN